MPKEPFLRTLLGTKSTFHICFIAFLFPDKGTGGQFLPRTFLVCFRMFSKLEDYSDALGVIVICCFWRFSFVVTNFLLSILFNPWIDLIGSVAGAVLSIHVVTSFAWKLFFRFFF